jgi:hypothetical protein
MPHASIRRACRRANGNDVSPSWLVRDLQTLHLFPKRLAADPEQLGSLRNAAFRRGARKRAPTAGRGIALSTVTLEQIDAAREKAHRAPLLLVAITCLGPAEPEIPALERMVSLGAAAQNVLLGAHAMGLGAGLTAGDVVPSPSRSAAASRRRVGGVRPVVRRDWGTLRSGPAGLARRPAHRASTRPGPSAAPTCRAHGR